MKKYLIVLGVLAALFVAGSAFAQMSGSAAGKDLQRCQGEADRQNISPADRNAFLDQCLGRTGTMGGSAAGKASAKDIQRCQGEADKQHIRPADRDAFVDQCLGGTGTMGGSQPMKERETYDTINQDSERMGGAAGPHIQRKSK